MGAFDAMVKKNAKVVEPKKKGKDYVAISLPSQLPQPDGSTINLQEKLANFLKEKEAMKNAETNMRIAEAPIIEFVKDRQDNDGLHGTFNSSYVLQGASGTEVKFIATDKWSVPQGDEEVEQIKSVLDTDFDTIIEEKLTVSLRDEVWNNEELQKELVEIIGDKFDKFFISAKKLTTKSGLDEKIYKIAKTPEKLQQIKGLLKQSKPFLK